VLLLHAHVNNLPPFLLVGVDTGGVVLAGVDQIQRSIRLVLHVIDHLRNVLAPGFLFVVRIGLDLETLPLEDLFMVSPSRSRLVDGVVLHGNMVLDELLADPQLPGTGQALL